MDSRSKLLFVLVAAAAAAVAAFTKRPVTHPERRGTWHPAEPEKTNR